ncbi:YraN family protein [Candidatus Uhrbacteria bacterium]|nr:YraN family protein [Candidatus Uhrbacteria bacterium]
MDARRDVGLAGERIACVYLRRHGYTIVHAPWRHLPHGEIDIVARHKGELVFVEVKTRRDNEFGYPEVAVTHAKRKKINMLIDLYFQAHKLPIRPHRFDVIAVEYGAPEPKITHIEAVGVDG